MNTETAQLGQQQDMPAMRRLMAERGVDITQPAPITGAGEAVTGSKPITDFIPTAKLLKYALMGTFKIIKPLRALEVEEPQFEALGEAWSPVLDKYMPNIPEGPITEACAHTAVILGPKVVKAKMKKKPEPDTTQPGQQQDKSPAPKKQDVSPAEELKPVSSRRGKKQ